MNNISSLLQVRLKEYEKPTTEHRLKQNLVDEIFEMAREQGCKLKIKDFYGILSPFMQKSVSVKELEDIKKECQEKVRRNLSVVAFIKITRK